MKKQTALIAMLGALVLCGCQFSKSVPSTPLRRVSYNVTGMRYPGQSYEICRNADGLVQLTYLDPMLVHANQSIEKGYVTVPVPAAIMDSLTTIIKEEGMMNYKDRYAPPKFLSVHDGDSWGLTIEFEGQPALESSGYHVTPSGEGLKRTHALLKKYAKNNQ